MKVYLLITLLLSILLSVTAAKDPPKKVLEPRDVPKFINTLPGLTQELQDFEFDYDAKKGTLEIPEAVKARKDFLAIGNNGCRSEKCMDFR